MDYKNNLYCYIINYVSLQDFTNCLIYNCGCYVV